MGTKSLAIFRTQSFRVHVENKGFASQLTYVHLAVFQQEDLVILLVLQLFRQNTAVRNRLLLKEFLSAAVTHSVQRGVSRQLQIKDFRPVPNRAFHNDGLADGISSAEFHIGQIQLKLKIQFLAGDMQNRSNVNEHKLPRNDTFSII